MNECICNIGSIANQISGGRSSQSPIGQKIQDAANKIESGANFISGNEDRAQQALSSVNLHVHMCMYSKMYMCIACM